MLQSSMGQHKLDVRRGDRNTLPYYNGVLLATLLTDVDVVAAICAGRVYSVASGGALVPGITPTLGATGGPIPHYGWSGLDDNNYPDSQRSRGMPGYLDKPAAGIGAPGAPGWPGIPLSPSGIVGGFATIQHIAAAELSTTEFDQSIALSTYTYGLGLTCVIATATGTGGVTGTNNKTVRGVLRPIELATDVLVARVAEARTFTGPEGYPTLAFTPLYVAGTTAPNSLMADD